MTTTRLTLPNACICKILQTTAQAYGIRWPGSTKADPKILASEFKDPIKFSL